MFVETRLGSIFVIASGEVTAPPLVLLHGSSANSLVWLADMTELRNRFRVYAVDTVGDPGKSSQAQPDFTAGTVYAGWLADVFTALKLQP